MAGAGAPDLSQVPAPDVPAALQGGIDKLSTPLRNLLMGKSVPYLIQHRLGMENYATIEDLADRWDTAQAAREHGPAAMRFQDGENGFTAETSDYAAIKLFQVVRASIRTCSRVTQQP